MAEWLERPATDPRNILAAERTLLAWIRTALAMMGFGFVVARFGLFLQEIAAPNVEHRPGTFSLLGGTALVLAGVATTAIGVWNHRRTLQSLHDSLPIDDRVQPAIFIAVVLGAIGMALAAYLLIAR